MPEKFPEKVNKASREIRKTIKDLGWEVSKPSYTNDYHMLTDETSGFKIDKNPEEINIKFVLSNRAKRPDNKDKNIKIGKARLSMLEAKLKEKGLNVHQGERDDIIIDMK
jgi:hypothetical protein